MTQARKAAKTPAKPEARSKLTVVPTKATAAAPAPIADAAPTLAPSTPRLVAFAGLRRAPENVRHNHVDEDVAGLADDIAAHGLLQSLIGYDGSWPEDEGRVFVVGGGRRLQALTRLRDAGVIDDAFTVPVLIRDVAEAVELSLAENLQQRTMSPVDEFLAFKALMDTGHHSPEGLAARFGFSERVVRQRLRLADVVPEVLDALAERRITIDAATAYAKTQDRDLQLAVFKVHERKSGHQHRPDDITWAVKTRGMRTTDPLFTFVGNYAYEREGGGYEDDLFTDATDGQAEGRVLDRPFLAREIARRLIEEGAPAMLAELREHAKLSPTIVGYVCPDAMRIARWGVSDPIVPPKGLVEIDRRYGNAGLVWKAIRDEGIDAHVILGIDDAGKLTAYTERLFVPKAAKETVFPTTPVQRAPELTPEQRAAEARDREISRIARRLAVGPFAGTPFEGRAFWPKGGWLTAEGDARVVDGVKGWAMPVLIFVSEADVASAHAAAAAEVDAAAEREAAEKAKRDTLLAADPPPAVVTVDGLFRYRWEDGGYWDAREEEGEDAAELGARTLAQLLRDATTVGEWWPTIAAFEARSAGGDL